MKNFFTSTSSWIRHSILITFVGVLLFTIIGNALTSRAFAAPYSSEDPSQTEYIQWVAGKIILYCLNTSDNIRIDTSTEDRVMSNLFSNAYMTPGLVFSQYGLVDNDNSMHCDNKTEMKKIIALLGVENGNLREFQAKIVELIPKYGEQTSYTKNEFISGVNGYMEANKLAGASVGDGTRPWGDLSEAAHFWYWNRVFRTSKSDSSRHIDDTNGACQGTFSNSGTARGATQIVGTYYSVSRKDSNSPYEVNERQYGYFEQSADTEIKGLDVFVYLKPGEKIFCKTVAEKMTKDRAQAYADRLNNSLDAGEDVAATSGSADPEDAASAPDESCEGKGGLLSWVMCPIISMIGGALEWVDRQLVRLLEIDRDKYATGDTGDSMYAAWSQFRNIGLTLLIAAMLVMVISTALGIGALDAYTVKKAFPRMVAAVIFMILSWYVCVFLIGLSNVVGRGVLGLMTSPFGGDVQSLSSLFTASAGGAAAQIGGGLTAVVAIWKIQSAAPILLSWLGSGLLVMLIAFLVLVARQMFIIVLILFSPLAILAWIFPGNDKLWKFWWQSFSKLLLMFPLIMALVASGRIFAGVINNFDGGGGEDLLNTLLKFTAYVIPYAFIPFTFKAAGGVFGNLAGMANDRSRGIFDRLKKGRQRNMDAIGQNLKAGELMRDTSRFNKRFNKIAAGAAQNPFTGAGFSAKNKANIERLKQAKKDQLLKEAGVNQLLMDDDVRGVLLAGEERADAFLAAKQIYKGSKKYNEVMGGAKSIGFSSSSRLAALEGESTHGKGRNMAAISSIYGAGTDQNLGMKSLIADVGRSAGLNQAGIDRLTQSTIYQFGSNSRGDLRQTSLGDVMDKKFDPGLLRGITEDGMEALATAEVGRLQGGNQAQQDQAASHLLTLHESRTGLSEPAIKKLDAALASAGVDLSSQESVETQLASRILGPDVASRADNLSRARKTLAQAQQSVDIEMSTSGTTTPTTRAAVEAARVQFVAAQQAYAPYQGTVTTKAQAVRASSATYSSSLPYAQREQQQQ